MKNKSKLIFFIIFVLLFKINNIYSSEQFNFDVTEIEILDEGNIFKGLKRGKITTDEGLLIVADEFEYNKPLNILNASGNVEITDKINDYIIFAEKVSYFKNQEKIFTIGNTKAKIQSKYNFESQDLILFRNENRLRSSEKSSVIDEEQTFYEFGKFEYLIDKDLLKGEDVTIITNFDKTSIERDTYKFKDGVFELAKKDFIASDTKINFKKNIFDVTDNDPRIYGISSKKKGNITTIDKAIFTSCKIRNEKCPPWSIKADKVKHDKTKKQMIYEKSVLRIYDIPVLYFPKFFHPDPSVERQSGFLQPQLNNSNILGSSILVPYYHVISKNRDLTFKPTIFDKEIYLFQNEYRQKNKKSNLITDIGLTKGYKSTLPGSKKNSIGHFFSKFNYDLKLDDFNKSFLDFSFEKVSMDTYLKIFDTNLVDTKIKPKNQDKLISYINLELDHDDFTMDIGMTSYETLKGSESDRYQYVLPYYNFYKNLDNIEFGNLSFSSHGNNNLKNTNNLTTLVNNNLEFNSFDYISNNGFKNNFKIFLKNVNTSGKNDEVYKSSVQSEIMSILNYEINYPLIKENEKFSNSLVPKLSFRTNPSDMKNYSDTEREINVDNIFSINRLGLDDTLEEGNSLTLGLDYKKEILEDINKYFELNLATVFRNKNEEAIPTQSTLDQKTSNIFGSSTYSISKNLNLDYDFAVDNDLKTFEYNSLGAQISLNNLVTNFNFVEKSGKMGDINFTDNTTTYKFDDNNFISFNTRRNRKIDLTEYYNLVYEYKNDCLTAGIKYKKTYYQDRDLKPKEDLLFTITLFPITQYEQKIDQSLYRD